VDSAAFPRTVKYSKFRNVLAGVEGTVHNEEPEGVQPNQQQGEAESDGEPDKEGSPMGWDEGWRPGELNITGSLRFSKQPADTILRVRGLEWLCSLFCRAGGCCWSTTRNTGIICVINAGSEQATWA
jgi:hypothetical protein